MLTEVDVKPLATRLSRLVAGDCHKLAPDALAPGWDRDHRVLDPGVHQSVPQHVDETDERAALSRHHPAQAVLTDDSLQLKSLSSNTRVSKACAWS